MRYKLLIDKLVNQQVPHFMGGRKLILYLQASLYPLQMFANYFRDWAVESRIEASMTSQVFKLEWFLNRKFSKYFVRDTDRIILDTHKGIGVPVYHENAGVDSSEHLTLSLENELSDRAATMYNEGENIRGGRYSFTVYSPAIDIQKIKKEEYLKMLMFWIDKYKLSSKTYTINIEQ